MASVPDLPMWDNSKKLVYLFNDVPLADIDRSLSPNTKIGQPVDLRESDGSIAVYQGGYRLGVIADGTVEHLVHIWMKIGEVFRADLTAYHWQGVKACIRIGFYRDPVEYLLGFKDSFTAKLNMVPHDLQGKLVGHDCHALYDHERGVFRVYVDACADPVGTLPPSVVECIHKKDLEPEDMLFCVQSVDYDTDRNRPVIRVVIA